MAPIKPNISLLNLLVCLLRGEEGGGWGNPECEGSKLFRYGIFVFVPIVLPIVPVLSWFSTGQHFSFIRLFASLPPAPFRIDPLVSNFSLP